MYITQEPGYSITSDSLRRAGSYATRYAKAIRSHADTGESLLQQGIQTTFVSGTAFGFGVLGGHQGAVDVLGVPVDVGAGILAHVAAAAGFAGKYGKQLHDIGDGALAAYFARLGARVGHNWARTAPRVRGERMMASGERRPLSPAEVGAYAMAAR